MTAYDLWFVVRSIDRSHGIIGVRGAQRSAHEEDARRPVASPGGRQQQQQQRCRSRLYKSFQDATDRSFMHLLPVLFETPPPSAGNVRSATTPRSHVDPRLQKKKKQKKKKQQQQKKTKQKNKNKETNKKHKKQEALLNISGGFLSSHAIRQPVRTSTREVCQRRVPKRAGGCSRAQAARLYGSYSTWSCECERKKEKEKKEKDFL